MIFHALDQYAIDRVRYPADGAREQQMYRAFIQRSEGDLQLDEYNWRWSPRLCTGEQCVKIINSSQSPVLDIRANRGEGIWEILEFWAYRVAPEVVLHWFGESRVTHGLATLQSAEGFILRGHAVPSRRTAPSLAMLSPVSTR